VIADARRRRRCSHTQASGADVAALPRIESLPLEEPKEAPDPLYAHWGAVQRPGIGVDLGVISEYWQVGRWVVFWCPEPVHNAVNWREYVAVGRLPFALRRADLADADVVRGLAREATKWLQGKNTDQWATPWPDPQRKDERLQEDLAAGRTWIVWDDDIGVGTVTINTQVPVDYEQNHVWPDNRQTETALYVRRMIVRRSHAGLGLGAGLLDWATDVAKRELSTTLLRIDVWTTNHRLHDYYRHQGFTLCEFRDPAALPDYPARALFERRINPNGQSRAALLFTGHQQSALTWHQQSAHVDLG
jgi:GNAT superfamily N-acetyltransferase